MVKCKCKNKLVERMGKSEAFHSVNVTPVGSKKEAFRRAETNEAAVVALRKAIKSEDSFALFVVDEHGGVAIVACESTKALAMGNALGEAAVEMKKRVLEMMAPGIGKVIDGMPHGVTPEEQKVQADKAVKAYLKSRGLPPEPQDDDDGFVEAGVPERREIG